MPRKPDRTEVKAPSKKAIVVKRALAKAGLQRFPLLYVQASLSVLNPLTEPRKRKIITLKTPVKTPRYLYSVNKKEVAPAKLSYRQVID